MAQLECKNLTIGYEDGIVAENINFSLEQGDYLCILGENGSGKTTLMKTLLGLIDPISGEIILNNGEGRGIGYLPQITQVQKHFPASVSEIILSGCLNKLGKGLFYKKEHKLLAQSNMEKLGISELAKKPYKNLSGGQQQRVLLARALCAAQNMLLLDEPITGLDYLATEEMYEYISKLNKEGMTIIMISHDKEGSLKYATHILDFKDKDIIFSTASEYGEGKAGEKND